VDQILSLANKALCKTLNQEIPLELKRRVAGGKSPTWDDLRRDITAQHEAADKPHDPPQPGPTAQAPAKSGDQSAEKNGLPIDDASLNLIQNAAESGELAVHRQGAEFSVAMPLSANDVSMIHAENDQDQRLLVKLNLSLLARLDGQQD
jgi:hypothetical protein